MRERLDEPTSGQGITPLAYTPAPERVPTTWQWRPLTVAAAVLVGFLLLTLALLIAARSVQISITPKPELVAIQGSLSFHLEDGFLLLPGTHRVTADHPGYVPFSADIEVSGAANQRFEFSMEKLPGLVSVATTPKDATLWFDGSETALTTPITDIELSAGEHEVRIEAAQHLAYVTRFDVEGLGKKQDFEFSLTPAWANIEFSTRPTGAAVLLGDTILGSTPGTVQIPMGDQRVVLKLKGYRSVELPLQVEPAQAQTIPTVELERADGIVMVRTTPDDASISVDGQFRGKSPIALKLRPGQPYRISAIKPGYSETVRNVTPVADDESTVSISLNAQIGNVRISVAPSDAQVLVNGVAKGFGDQVLQLPAIPQDVQIKKDGYVSYRTQLTPRPGFETLVNANLLTVEQARIAAATEEVVSPKGIRMKLIFPKAFSMGASRREPGRRANEVLRQVTLTRPYYLGMTEVDNALFRQFRLAHDSGKFEQVDLNGDHQPAVRLTWMDAVSFCNWLSSEERLKPYYRIEQDGVAGVDAQADGYRLPTEAEWEFAARVVGDTLLRYPWGPTLPPPDRSGNYADRTASNVIGRIILNYTDGYIGSAPVGQYAPNHFGLMDMGGNVAEWVHDYYEIPTETPVTNPSGPVSGEYHVIRGSSWMHGTVADLRLSFRDYAAVGRQDVGFRLARSQL